MFTITQDLVDNRFTKVVGPRGASLSSDEIQKQGQKFRMLDDDRNIYCDSADEGYQKRNKREHEATAAWIASIPLGRLSK